MPLGEPRGCPGTGGARRGSSPGNEILSIIINKGKETTRGARCEAVSKGQAQAGNSGIEIKKIN